MELEEIHEKAKSFIEDWKSNPMFAGGDVYKLMKELVRLTDPEKKTLIPFHTTPFQLSHVLDSVSVEDFRRHVFHPAGYRFYQTLTKSLKSEYPIVLAWESKPVSELLIQRYSESGEEFGGGMLLVDKVRIEDLLKY